MFSIYLIFLVILIFYCHTSLALVPNLGVPPSLLLKIFQGWQFSWPTVTKFLTFPSRGSNPNPLSKSYISSLMLWFLNITFWLWRFHYFDHFFSTCCNSSNDTLLFKNIFWWKNLEYFGRRWRSERLERALKIFVNKGGQENPGSSTVRF